MNTWRLLYTPPSSGAWNMAVDESILEHIYRGEALPTLRLYSWNPPCLSLGHAQSFADVDMERVKTNGWEVVRRLTGGRAILHTDELTYSVTGSASEPILSGSILESYNRLAQALMFAVRELGLPVEMKEHSPAGEPATLNLPEKGKRIFPRNKSRLAIDASLLSFLFRLSFSFLHPLSMRFDYFIALFNYV